MSENNSENNQAIITEAEVLPPEQYDFDFIVNALGLIPYQALAEDDQTTFQGALNPGAIINFEITGEGYGAFTLHGGEEILMDRVHLTLFEKTLKRKIEEAQAKAREAMLQMQGGGLVGVGADPRKRGRFH